METNVSRTEHDKQSIEDVVATAASEPSLVQALSTLGSEPKELQVALSNELVELLSTQMYQSPVKAIEELVVNAYDADAAVCRVFVPGKDDERDFVVVFDDGFGMDYEGMVNLWQIGRSNKRKSEIERRSNRKQIGKFGIGKLASYTLARYVTYVSCKDGGIRFVSLDFTKFSASAGGQDVPVTLTVREIQDYAELSSDESFVAICESCGVNPETLFDGTHPSWTFCVLEELKAKARQIKSSHLKWVLSTAMPLKSSFKLFLEKVELESAKAVREPLVDFSVADLAAKRLEAIRKPSESSSGEDWKVDGDKLVSPRFPSGVHGRIIVTTASLYGGKSADLERSHGFFIRVRDRLVNESEPLFGVHPLSYEIWNRFRADIHADDLDPSLVAPREGVSETPEMVEFRRLLVELFYDARERYGKAVKDEERTELHRKEHERNYVTPRLVEFPLADVLASGQAEAPGAEADKRWFYLRLSPGMKASTLVQDLYSGRRGLYRFSFSSIGRDNRMAVFDPAQREFTLNADHELVREYAGDPRAAQLLSDLVAAEALLEIYLRENAVPAHIAGDILERRDSLFRSLAKDHPSSVTAIAAALRESKSSERDLEMGVVAAARALGFVATHVSGEGEPDGLARFNDHSGAPKTITLEAKSSAGTPQLPQLDFAGLADHVRDSKAHGCMLVAPSYPGSGRGDESAVSTRAQAGRISCWTVDQLARVVEHAERRHITARQVLEIVLTAFTPNEVNAAIEKLLAEPSWEMRALYQAIVRALIELEGRLSDSPRTVDMVAGEVSRYPEFVGVRRQDVAQAVRDLAHTSQGGLTLTGEEVIHVHVAYEEIERRVNQLTARHGPSRRKSTFREP
jgi:hypothetical protein